MSATNHTANLNLPIYQPNDVLNYTLDWNGAMQTLDTSVTANKTLGDRLETEFENIQTDFETVSSKADSAATTAAAANSAATNAVTIANNASTMAGDAKTDAHAALSLLENLTVINKTPSMIVNTIVQIANNPVGYFHIYCRSTKLGFLHAGEMIFTSNPSKMPTNDWTLVPGQSLVYYSPSYVFNEMPYIDTQSSATGIYSFGNQGIWTVNTNNWEAIPNSQWNPNVIAMGLYINNSKCYMALQFNPNTTQIYRTNFSFYVPNSPRLLHPISLMDLTYETYPETIGTYIPLDN